MTTKHYLISIPALLAAALVAVTIVLESPLVELIGQHQCGNRRGTETAG